MYINNNIWQLANEVNFDFTQLFNLANTETISWPAKNFI